MYFELPFMRNLNCPDDGVCSVLFVSSKLGRRFDESHNVVRVVDKPTETEPAASQTLYPNYNSVICCNH